MPRLRHLYLPRLADDAEGVGEPETAGAWEDSRRKLLRSISNGIEVDEQARVRGVSSVPDIWARPLMFQTAVRPNSHHPLRRRMVQEWRGLLSLLALRQIRSYKVEVVPVSFGQGGTFVRALRKLGPDDVQLEPDQSYQWTDVLMIRYEGIPIGAFSPTTLVYTSVDYQKKLRDLPLNLQQRDTNKHKTGYLAPPTHREEKEYVGEWVYALKQRLGGLLNLDDQHPDHTVSLAINELLDDWLAELRDDLDLGAREEIDARDVAVADEPTRLDDSWSPLERYGVYRALLRPLVMDEEARASAGERHSDLALDSARNESDYDEVVVLTPRLLKQDVKIWKTTRLSHLGGDADAALARDFDAASGTVIDSEDLSNFDACWIRPERYFLTDALVKAPGNEPLLAAGERTLNEGGRFLLPFKKEILDFFSPQDVQDLLAPTFEDTGDGIRFSFSLPIAGGRTADVEKTYRLKDPRASEGRIAETPAPVLELFPNYLGDNWRRYYLFQGSLGELEATPVLYGDGEATAREHEGQLEGKRHSVRTTEMRGGDAFPEGIAFTETGSGAPCGLLLIEKPLAPQQRLTGPNRWRVGIDFGTSNTTIFLSSGKAQKWEFAFSKHFRSLTTSPDDARANLLEHYFLPDADIELPVPTYLRVLRGSEEKKLLLDYSAHFSSSYQLPGYVETNVKWEGNPDLIEHFVESLLFLVLLEATSKKVKKLKLACSYPEAFSNEIESMFRQAWREKLRSLTHEENRVLSIYQRPEDQGVKLHVESDIAFEREGYAAGEFFGSDKIVHPSDEADKQGAAVLDVGGGTTDISIWYNGRIIHSTSLLLAGRQIAAYLEDNAQLRGLLFSKEAAIALQDGAQESGTRFASRLNSVLRREGENVQKLVAKHGTRDEVRRLRQIIAFEFGALAYYTAALVGAVDQTPAGEGILDWIVDSKNGMNEFKLHWGGNAAKLLSWVDHGGSYRKDGVAAKVLTAMTFNALRNLGDLQLSSNRIGQVMSPDHKSEAAGGLSVMQLGKYGRQSAGSGDASRDEMAFPGSAAQDTDAAGPSSNGAPPDDGVVCGETVRLTSGSISFTDFISNSVLFENGRTTYEGTDLEQFTQFVEMINYFGTNYGLFSESMKIELSDSDKRAIARKVRNAFKEARSLPDKKRVIEPVFIMEAKALLSLIGSGRR